MNLGRIRSFLSSRIPFVIVLVLMVGALFAVPLFSDPYGGSEGHDLVRESSEEFNATIDHHDIAVDDPTPVSDLSPTAQRIVNDALREMGDRPEYRYRATFCRDDMPICDEYESRPPDFEYGYVSPEVEQYTVIEAEGEVYLVETGHQDGIDRGPYAGLEVTHLLVVFVYLPVVGAVFRQGIWRRNPDPKRSAAVAAYGLLLAAAGVADPLLRMFYDVSIARYGWGLFGLTWAILVGSALLPAVVTWRRGDTE